MGQTIIPLSNNFSYPFIGKIINIFLFFISFFDTVHCMFFETLTVQLFFEGCIGE